MRKQTTVADVLAEYERGERLWLDISIGEADFWNCELDRAQFIDVALRGARFDEANLVQTDFSRCDLTGASFAGTPLQIAHLYGSDLSGARLVGTSLLGTKLENVNLSGADLTHADLVEAHLKDVDLDGTRIDAVVLGGTTFTDMDLAALCEGGVVHQAPSYVDFRSVLRSYAHPGLKRFLVDCGVPPLVADYTIAAAEAEGEDTLRSLMRSTFISYGGPDEPFARRLYEELRAYGVVTYFFPESARLGERIGNEVRSRIQEHDRVILVCSEASLDRPGVRNEIQETFDREARDGGATYLIPITIDDYVLTRWNDPLAERVRGRVVGDFHGGRTDRQVFDKAMARLLAALRKEPT